MPSRVSNPQRNSLKGDTLASALAEVQSRIVQQLQAVLSKERSALHKGKAGKRCWSGFGCRQASKAPAISKGF